MGMRLLWRCEALRCGMGGISAGGVRPMHTHLAALQPTIRLPRPLPRTIQAHTENWLAGQLAGQLAGWLAGLSADWLAGWLAGWVASWLAGRLGRWLAGWLAGRVGGPAVPRS